jgi:predicted RNA-binding protein YlqC (UPF0109 family)
MLCFGEQYRAAVRCRLIRVTDAEGGGVNCRNRGGVKPGRRFGSVEADVEGPMKPLVMAIVQSLVDKPEEVQIKEVIGEHAHVLELRVAKDDLGKVIGKGGAHASAIRTIMAATSGKEKKRYILEIMEN